MATIPPSTKGKPLGKFAIKYADMIGRIATLEAENARLKAEMEKRPTERAAIAAALRTGEINGVVIVGVQALILQYLADVIEHGDETLAARVEDFSRRLLS